MKVIKNAAKLHGIMGKEKVKGKSIGFVPTMGALHEGHLSLIRASVAENDISVASIFVNPTQFGPSEDLDNYPRDFETDKSTLENEGCDFLFAPDVNEIYGNPEGRTLTWVEVEELPNHLCGLSRPGHFRGVTTIVTKLFNIVRPDRAYFGQKDYQQAQIIRRLNTDLNFFIDIRVMPIVREADGLAMSSRNRYLLPEERKNAMVLCRALEFAKNQIYAGEKDALRLQKEIIRFIQTEVPGARIDYAEIVNPKTLDNIKRIEGTTLVALAVFIGSTRLIDNALIETAHS